VESRKVRLRPASGWLIAAGLWLLGLLVPCAAAPAPTAPPSPAPDGWHTFWSVQGRHNTVWLLDSVHLLQPQDATPPPPVLQAYRASARLVMELDLGELGPDALLGERVRLLRLPQGQTLRGTLGDPAYERLASAARPLGLDPNLMNAFQPWFAAMTLEQLQYLKRGYDPLSGVDQQFARLAEADGKPIIGLETLDEQLGFFASMTLPEQRDLLLQTLDDADEMDRTLRDTVLAWRAGDARALEALLQEGREKAPELYRRLTTDRNRRWLKQLLPLLEQREDVLVIVGALHLVGDDGLVRLLEQQGFKPRQH
jgi:uncharacterized protein